MYRYKYIIFFTLIFPRLHSMEQENQFTCSKPYSLKQGKFPTFTPLQDNTGELRFVSAADFVGINLAGVSKISFNPFNQQQALAITGFKYQEIQIDLLDKTSKTKKRVAESETINCCAWDLHNQNQLALACTNGKIKIWDVQKDICLTEFEENFGQIISISFDPHQKNRLALAQSFGGQILLFDRALKTSAKIAMGNGDRFTLVIAFDPHCPQRLVSLHETGKCVIWDLAEKELFEIVPGDLAFSMTLVLRGGEIAFHPNKTNLLLLFAGSPQYGHGPCYQINLPKDTEAYSPAAVETERKHDLAQRSLWQRYPKACLIGIGVAGISVLAAVAYLWFKKPATSS